MKQRSLMVALALTASNVHAQDLRITPYGFIKASATVADHALGSFNDINESAPTFAVARTRDVDNNSRTSFQVAQSRIGATLSKSERVSGRLEFDFIDFNKASPTTQMVPRVRRAVVTYKGDGWHTDIGQDWDLFSPVNAYTYDIVGLYFNAGNTGFMRQQAQFHRDLESWQLSAAIGMAGSNPGVADTNLETSSSPTYSIRAKRTVGDLFFGYSGIYARLNYADTNDRWTEAYGNNLFLEKENASWGIKGEIFQGQNLANIGALSLARGTDTTNVREYGAHLSAQKFRENGDKFFGGVGIDRIDNKASIQSASISTNGTINNNRTGARNNFITRLGYDHLIEKDFSWVAEATRYETNSKLAADRYKTFVTFALETGILWKF